MWWRRHAWYDMAMRFPTTEVLEKLGKCGMGMVFKAYDTTLKCHADWLRALPAPEPEEE